jgi:hypothetical protein
LLLLLTFLIPYLVLYFISFRVPMFTSRYLLFTSVPFFLFTGVGLDRLFANTMLLKVTLLFLVIGTNLAYTRPVPGDYYYREVRKSVAYCDSVANGIAPVFIFPAWLDLEYCYYSNPSAYTSPVPVAKILKAKNIHLIVHAEEADTVLLRKASPQQVVLYSDDPGRARELLSTHLCKNMQIADSAFFPQAGYVYLLSTLDPEDRD